MAPCGSPATELARFAVHATGIGTGMESSLAVTRVAAIPVHVSYTHVYSSTRVRIAGTSTVYSSIDTQDTGTACVQYVLSSRVPVPV